MNDPSRRTNNARDERPPVSRQDYWETRYREHRTGWDRGQVHPALGDWRQTGALFPCRIVVPGCGRGYEVVELVQAGFEVTAIDFATTPLRAIQSDLERRDRINGYVELLQRDVFEYQPDRPFDAIYEQTCLCAIDPTRRIDYANQLQRWLRPGGNLLLLLLQTPLVTGDPPYHCDVQEMRTLFSDCAWEWPDPPYTTYPHPTGMVEEVAVVLRRAEP